MNVRIFKAILGHELRCILRNRRALIMMLIPLIVTPLLISILSSQYALAQQSVYADLPIAVTFEISQQTQEQQDVLQRRLLDSLPSVRVLQVQDPFTALQEENIFLELICKDDVRNLDENLPFNMDIIYNNQSAKSTTALAIVQPVVNTLYREIVEQTLIQQQISPAVLDQATFTAVDFSTLENKEGSAGSATLAMLLPMLMAMLILSGGSSVGVDVLAGERERGTLENLLLTQASRTSIVCAKSLTVFLVTLGTALLSLAGYLLAIMINPAILATQSGQTVDIALNLSASSMLYLLVSLVMLSMLASSLVVVFSISSHTAKEASTKCSLFTIIPTLISGLIIFLQVGNLPAVAMAIPFFNALMVVKDAVDGGHFNTIYLLIMSASTLIYALSFARIAVARMCSEKVCCK